MALRIIVSTKNEYLCKKLPTILLLLLTMIITIIFLFLRFLFAHTEPKNHYKVYVFLSEECPISQYYTLELKNLHQQFHSDSVVFMGIFPVKTSTPATIQKFVDTYGIPFATRADVRQRFAKKMGATIVPQVFVLRGRTLLYSGKIDNSYERVGKRRTIITQHLLHDVLTNIVQNQPIVPSKTEPIGCIFR
jgi:hypothetical protein